MTARVPSGEFTVTCPECGFTRTRRTAGLADKALEKHSCDRQRREDARAARVQARATSEGVKRDCQCKIANHVHGTPQAYVIDKCRCRPCRSAISAARRQENKDKAYGRYDHGRVDAAPIRERCLWLSENGISLKRLSILTGISNATISKLLYGVPSKGIAPRKRVDRATAEKILAIKPTLELMAPGQTVDSTGTVRRLRALVAIGWSQSRLAKQIGMERGNFGVLMNGQQCTAKRALQVRALYERCWDQPQAGHDWHTKTAATKARNYAAARGWAPPMAWDDDAIDNPAAVPDMGERTKLRDTIAEDVEYLHKTGASREEIAERLGSTMAAIEKQLYRIGRGDLVTTIKTDARPNARQARKGQAA